LTYIPSLLLMYFIIAFVSVAFFIYCHISLLSTILVVFYVLVIRIAYWQGTVLCVTVCRARPVLPERTLHIQIPPFRIGKVTALECC
jgi:hypothetical protein